MNKFFKMLVVAMFGAMIMLTAFESVEVKAAGTHTVTFLYGTKSNVQQVAHGANAVIPTDIQLWGYTFGGWIGDVTNVTEDRIILGAYYPKKEVETWTINPVHTVEDSSFFVNTYGLKIYKSNPTIKINDNKSAPAPEWWKDLNLPKGVPGVTCAVYWMNGWNGELWKTDIVPYGATCPDPGNPCLDGWEFIGWEGSWENVTEDRVIKAWYYKK